MTGGTICKWLKSEGDSVNKYDLIFEVDTDTLVEDAYKLGDFEGTVRLTIESQEDGYLGKILVPEGQAVAAGTPVAVVCEDKEQLSNAASWSSPTSNVYDETKPQVRVLEWQSFLKESKETKTDRSCM
eukprot:jgi/Chrzof1/5110/Cz15g11230.t1